MSVGTVIPPSPHRPPADSYFPVAPAAAVSCARPTVKAEIGLAVKNCTPAGRHKRVRWRKPGGARRPGVIDATRCELVRSLEQRHGSVWARIKDQVHVAGYTVERARERVRAFRSDGAESLLAMVVALLYMTDVRTGFIGKPRAGGGRWQRYTLRDMAQLAYGGQGEKDVRRASRAIAVMVSLGWAYPTKQVRRYVGDTTFRSEAGIRRLNLRRICDMTGTTWLLQRDRRHADQKHGASTAWLEEAKAKAQARKERLQARRAQLERLADELKAFQPGAGSGPAVVARNRGAPALLSAIFENAFG